MVFEGSGLGASAGGGPAGPALVAYFTMEVALEDAIPTFSGGLGVLAGDYLKSAADLGLPLVAVTLLYRRGYFRQHVDERGSQSESAVAWDPGDVLEPTDAEVDVEISGRQVRVGAWRLLLTGLSGAVVPVYFLDTDRDVNVDEDRALTDSLYGGDDAYRLRQEVVLGDGGVAMLAALGHRDVEVFHMNEGHSALLTLRLLSDSLEGRATSTAAEVAAIRERTAFTTHTPVPAGHDRFPADLVSEVLGGRRTALLEQLGLLDDDVLNMTELGARLSRYVNGVSWRHRAVAQVMLPESRVTSVTNGVHVATWASPPMAELFDRHVAGWRYESALLRYVGVVPLDEIAAAHGAAKQALLEEVRRRTGTPLDRDAFTIGLARRVTPYKRTLLLFGDRDRLSAIAAEHGPLQVVCSGKAHPRDAAGKALIVDLVQAAHDLAGAVSVVFVENYDLGVAGLVCAGSDLWLNTPQAPNEASGTSGMKAAVNGVPSLSILDGWWVEGCVETVTGWSIGGGTDTVNGVPDSDDARSLYDRLEQTVLPLFRDDPDGYTAVRRHAIALNASFFSTDRMVREYAREAYRL
jgi:starch phosphorylase